MSPQQAFSITQQILIGANIKKDKWAKKIYKKYKKNGWVRVPEYEDYLMDNIFYSFYYATEILRNKLPEKMHNKMICWSFSNEKYAKLYFEFIKNK
jgi:hypothetical protein